MHLFFFSKKRHNNFRGKQQAKHTKPDPDVNILNIGIFLEYLFCFAFSRAPKYT